MQIESRDGAPERELLTAMIVHKGVLSRLAPHWQEPGPFRSRFANVVGKWCVDYLASHKDAPKRHVQTLFSAWAQRQGDEATVKLVEAFLVSISEEYEQAGELKEDYLVSLAENLFNQVRAERLKEQIDQLLGQGKTNQALEAISSFSRLEVTGGKEVNVLTTSDWIDRVLTHRTEPPLITFPGDAGKFLDVPDCFHRDCFVSFLGKKGVGKTYHLVNVAWLAMEQRKRVAFFEVGDMSEVQINGRFLQRACKRPLWPGEVRRPSSIRKEAEKHFCEYQIKHFDRGIDGKLAREKFQELIKTTIKSDKEFLKVSCHPARSISVMGIDAVLGEWSRKGWDCDVCVIDYADLLAPITGKYEHRDQINETWTALRALSQRLHCLVVTATQTKAAAYHSDLVQISDFSDDRRKIDHVNAMIGICQTSEERTAQIQRLNFVSLREAAFDERRTVAIASCLATGEVMVKSLL